MLQSWWILIIIGVLAVVYMKPKSSIFNEGFIPVSYRYNAFYYDSDWWSYPFA